MKREEWIMILQNRVRLFERCAVIGYFAVWIVLAVLCLISDRFSISIPILVIWPFALLPFTGFAGVAVYYNYLLPKSERVRTTDWNIRRFSGKGPGYVLSFLMLFQILTFGIVIERVFLK